MKKHGCRYAGCKRSNAVRKTFMDGRVYEVKKLGACFMHLLYYRKLAQKYLRLRRQHA